MTPQDTMRLALEALEIVKLHFTQNRHVKEAIEALRSALAQQDELGNASKAEQLLASHDHSLRAEFGRMKAALAQQGEQRGSAGGLGNFDRAMSVSGAVLNPFQGAPAARPVAQQGEQPVAWPQTPEQISDFIGSNFVWREGNDVAPKDGDKYCVTAHDLLSAFREWPEFAAAPVQPECDAARVLEWMRTPNRKPAQLAFTEGLERQAAYWVEIAQGEPLRAQPLTCDTCKFSEADKDNPAIRIYEETCFWCSQYYANHYEAHGIGVQK